MSAAQQQPIAVIGAGSWGTAMAFQTARAGRETILWSHNPDHISEMEKDRSNEKYLPGIPFPDNLKVSADLQASIEQVRDILVVVPSHVFRDTMNRIEPFLNENHRVAWGTKGLERGTRKLLHQIVREEVGITVPTAAISGPTFAREVAMGMPGAITVASKHDEFAIDMAEALHSEYFRTYTSDDIIGVEIGGASKNVMAIAAGIADGMGYGTNTRAALITRALAEIIRLGEVLGGRRDTFMGLSGLGDLVLTCSDDQSRNRRMGLALGRGESIESAKEKIGQVVEGLGTAKTIYFLAQDFNVDMPITENVYKIIYESLPVKEAVTNLMHRALKAEY